MQQVTLTSGLLQNGELQIGILVFSRDSRVADVHGLVLSLISGTTKSLIEQGRKLLSKFLIFGTAFLCEARNEDQPGFIRQLAVHYQQEEIIMPTAPTTARLEARISPEVHALLKCAAELQGRTLTDFVVSAAQDAARLAIEQAKTIRLSLADQERFAHALLAPPEPAPALQRAFARRRQLLAAE